MHFRNRGDEGVVVHSATTLLELNQVCTFIIPFSQTYRSGLNKRPCAYIIAIVRTIYPVLIQDLRLFKIQKWLKFTFQYPQYPGLIQDLKLVETPTLIQGTVIC